LQPSSYDFQARHQRVSAVARTVGDVAFREAPLRCKIDNANASALMADVGNAINLGMNLGLLQKQFGLARCNSVNAARANSKIMRMLWLLTLAGMIAAAHERRRCADTGSSAIP
jgi:hypothetical protein